MNRLKIEGSSNIAEAGYDPEEMSMEIKFHNGDLYRYHPITLTGWKAFNNSDSKGSFFAKNIRNDPQISYQKIDELQAKK